MNQIILRVADLFPEFLARFPPAASLAYIADVARLEWAVNRALHAPDAAPLDVARLADRAGGRGPHPLRTAPVGQLD